MRDYRTLINESIRANVTIEERYDRLLFDELIQVASGAFYKDSVITMVGTIGGRPWSVALLCYEPSPDERVRFKPAGFDGGVRDVRRWKDVP